MLSSTISGFWSYATSHRSVLRCILSFCPAAGPLHMLFALPGMFCLLLSLPSVPPMGLVLHEGKGQGCGATQMELAALWGPNKLPKSWLQLRGRALSFRTENSFSLGLCRERLAQRKRRYRLCVRVLSKAGPPGVRPLRSFLFCFRAALDKGTNISVSPSANDFSLWDCSGDTSTQISLLRPGFPPSLAILTMFPS